MSRRPDHLGKRKDFSALVKKQVRERANYTCEYPGCEKSAHQVDHIIPEGLGGKSTYDNAQLLCDEHHKAKTALDVKMMAKADRQGGRSGQYVRRSRNGGSKMVGPKVSRLSKHHPYYQKRKFS